MVLWFALVAWMALGAGDRRDWLLIVWCMFLCVLVVQSIISSFVRRRSMRGIAAVHGLSYSGNLLPGGLDLYRTSFAAKEFSVSSCVSGDLGSIPVSVFDLSHRKGKASLTQTVVAFRRDRKSGLAEAPIDALGSYEYEGEREWVIGYVRKRVVETEELEEWGVELHTLPRSAGADKRR